MCGGASQHVMPPIPIKCNTSKSKKHSMVLQKLKSNACPGCDSLVATGCQRHEEHVSHGHGVTMGVALPYRVGCKAIQRRECNANRVHDL